MLPKIATPKQRLVYDYGMKHPYSIWAMDPRLGKSLVGISVQQALRNRCLVICPGYLVSNWAKEIRKWSRPGTTFSAFKEGKRIFFPADNDFVVVSYNLVQKAPYLFEWCQMILIDEAHHLANMSTNRSQFIHKQIYENMVPRVHELSGTIIKNRVREFYSPLALMHYDPNGIQLEDAKDSFMVKNAPKVLAKKTFLDRFTDEVEFADHFSYREEYNVEVTTKKGQVFFMPVAKWRGLRRVDELKLHLKDHYIRVKADEKDLPPLSWKTILVSDNPNKALLKAFDDHFQQDGASSVRPDIKVEAAMKKVPFTIEYAEDLLTSVECVLIYSDHVAPIEAIAKHFGVTAITGKVPASKRAEIADAFQSGRGSVLCATIGALKEGRDLFRAKDIVLNDPAWVPGDLKQMANRIRGLGQKGARTVHEIFGSPQDEKISDALKEKMEVIEAAT